ncbi:MAG TPA: response regulator [Polyangia bacterium]|jgi:CheY-like chemotaxis protein|nr:response regulator [Polyangia bacterium]
MKKILLVDDSETILLLETKILKRSRWTLVTARNGKEAIAKAMSEKPDLILMDVVMPEMGGFEACKQLRSLEPTRAIPIILVTTRGEVEHLAAGYASGCTDYLTKPIQAPDMLAKIECYLGA